MSITLIIVLITSTLSVYALKQPRLMNKLIFSPNLIYKNREFLRLLTSGFIHADFLHLAFNMFALYSFGENLEASYIYYFGLKGKYYFVLLYLTGIIIANIPSFIKHKRDINYFSLGASGGVDAIIFSCILYSPNSPICLFYFVCLPSFFFGILYIVYTIYSSRTGFQPMVNHMAHLTGAIYGIVFNIILEPKIIIFFFYQIKRLILGYF